MFPVKNACKSKKKCKIHKKQLHFLCRCILCIVSRLIKIYGEYIYEQAAERSQNSCFVYERGDSVFCEKEDGKEKQSSFLTLFMKVDRHFMTKCFGQMQELGIYPGQIPVLGLVAKKDGLSQRELAKILNIKPPTVNVSVQRLEKEGFLYNKPDEKDQRVTRIYLTEKGKETKAKALERIHKNEAVMLEGFSEAEQCLLRRFLEQILANIEKIQPEEFTGKTPMEEITEKEEQKRD